MVVPMTALAMRVIVPDRPGALGAVASRIGAVRGNVLAIEILQCSGGEAEDELVIELPSDDLIPLLAAEVSEVDGVRIEEVRSLPTLPGDRRLEALESARLLLVERSAQGLLEALASRVGYELEAAWAAITDTQANTHVATHGRPPTASWISSYITDAREQAGMHAHASTDIAWADLAHWDVVVTVGRPGRPLRQQERLLLAALTALADARWHDLASRNPAPEHQDHQGSRNHQG